MKIKGQSQSDRKRISGNPKQRGDVIPTPLHPSQQIKSIQTHVSVMACYRAMDTLPMGRIKHWAATDLCASRSSRRDQWLDGSLGMLSVKRDTP